MEKQQVRRLEAKKGYFVEVYFSATLRFLGLFLTDRLEMGFFSRFRLLAGCLI
jgi:hypothetical protein